MKRLLILFLILLAVQGYSITKLDQLNSELKSASGERQILILDELQKSYWDVYPQASLEYGIQALKLSAENNDKLIQTKQLQNIAISYKYLHNYKKAIEYMTLSLKSAKKIGNIELQIDAYYYLARFNNLIRNNVVAFDNANQALKLSKLYKNHIEMAKGYFVIAEIYHSLGDITGAYENYEHSLDQHYNFNDKASLAKTCEKLAEIDLEKKNYYFAKLHYKTAIDNYSETDNLGSLVRCYEAMGKIYRKTGDQESAYRYIKKFSELNDKLIKKMTSKKYLYNYEYYNVIGNEDKALNYYKLYTAYQDTLQLEINQEQVEILISDIESKHKIEKAKSTEKLKEVTKTAEEKQKQFEKLEIESDYIEQSKNRQIEKLQYERTIKDLKISKQKKEKDWFIFILIIFGLLLILIASITFIYISKYRLKKKHAHEMEKMAKTDPLTKLPNRRAVYEFLNYEMIRFKRNSQPFTIVISDIDNFKQINDTYGHDAGDKVLVTLSKLIKSTIRNSDICARWGGEEFLFLLPETDIIGGKIISEKIRKIIESKKVYYKNSTISVTMTFGLCQFSRELKIDECISHADEALYVGKEAGKNRIQVYSESLNNIEKENNESF